MKLVIRADHAGGYVYRVQFNDGVEGEIDLSSYLNRGPVFQRFADPEYFKQGFIEGGTLAWPGGVDIAPERLYEMLIRERVGESPIL